MARFARALTSVFLAVLVLLEATPSTPAMAHALPGRARRCEIVASVVPVTLLALPSERATSPADPGGLERVPLAPFTILSACAFLTKLAVAPVTDANAAARTRRAWVQILRQRARAPDDPDPL